MKVAVLDDYHHVFEADPAVQRLRQRVPVDVYTEKLTSLDLLREYQALIALRERTRFDSAFFEAVPGLELISQTGNHVYHVDLAAATQAGVLVGLGSSDLPAAQDVAASTIELTFGLMLAIMRRIPQTDRAIREGEWPLVLGRALSGKKLGILGLGRIGRQVARIAQAFGMQVLAWGPTLTPERAAQSGATYTQLDDLLEAADVVSVHLALSDTSRGLIDEARLRRIGPDSWLINTSRGAIIDEPALARVLAEGALGGAAMDVFTEEPLPASSLLRELDNVVLTSHCGWPSDATYRQMAETSVRIIESYMDGTLGKPLNPEALQHRKP
ncbi:MAG TPA: D-2-hydroxyacid dehydrogenase family protein [Chloroflexota bacterium]|nr:D-2-hydroxyacid dehydrogenase family protein [Chloroflexota bacterium]